MKMKASQYVGPHGAAFERVCLAFESLGYVRPRADTGDGAGAYAMNIADQYAANLRRDEALAIVAWALGSSRDAIRNRYLSEREIIGMYGE